jgi:Arc/MetJ-type ribon-helix-helix transcriptional regulator
MKKTLTIRTDPEVEQALDRLVTEGRSRSEVVRAAILDADRARRRERLRAEAERLRDDPADRAAATNLAEEMRELSAW